MNITESGQRMLASRIQFAPPFLLLFSCALLCTTGHAGLLPARLGAGPVEIGRQTEEACRAAGQRASVQSARFVDSGREILQAGEGHSAVQGTSSAYSRQEAHDAGSWGAPLKFAHATDPGREPVQEVGQTVLKRPSLRRSPRHAGASWDPFLDTLQERTLRYFLETADTVTGLSPDRFPTPAPSSIAAVGFAITSYPIAVERGIIARDRAASRTLTTLRFLLGLPQRQNIAVYGSHGLFYHFIDMHSGQRVWNSELSTIDTGLLMAGVLFAQSYYDRENGVEGSIRLVADSLYRRVDWRWAMNGSAGLRLAWSPEKGWSPHSWKGYNEAMIMYILALGSPTSPVPSSAWIYWTSGYIWARYGGENFVSFGPLFGHQYSHCWIDFAGIQDQYMASRGIDYAENSRRATISQCWYGLTNPAGYRGYADSIWGWTACDGPRDTSYRVDGSLRRFQGYGARGVSFDWINDDGTIAPSAAGGSVAFAPEIAVPALKAIRMRFGDRVFRKYGFIDSFNPTYTAAGEEGWFDGDYLGIDQGPIAIMIENLRNGFVWRVMKNNRYIARGLQAAGFIQTKGNRVKLKDQIKPSD